MTILFAESDGGRKKGKQNFAAVSSPKKCIASISVQSLLHLKSILNVDPLQPQGQALTMGEYLFSAHSGLMIKSLWMLSVHKNLQEWLFNTFLVENATAQQAPFKSINAIKYVFIFWL